MLKRINHPNIIRLVEVLDDPKKDQLFMGMGLRQWLTGHMTPLWVWLVMPSRPCQ
jgi:hypothetical protein